MTLLLCYDCPEGSLVSVTAAFFCHEGACLILESALDCATYLRWQEHVLFGSFVILYQLADLVNFK